MLHTNRPCALSNLLQSSSLPQLVVQSFNWSPCPGPVPPSPLQKPSRQSTSLLQTNPSRPGMQTAGLAGPEIARRQKWLGGQRPCESQLGTQMSGGSAAAGI